MRQGVVYGFAGLALQMVPHKFIEHDLKEEVVRYVVLGLPKIQHHIEAGVNQ